MTPKGFIVVPITELTITEASQNEDHEKGNTGAPHDSDSMLGSHGIQDPHNGHKQTDKGEVSVPVRHWLRAHRYDPDHRDQSPQKPEPANRQIAPVAPAQHQGGN